MLATAVLSFNKIYDAAIGFDTRQGENIRCQFLGFLLGGRGRGIKS